MNCQNHTENLTAYLDGELADREIDELERHLEACSRCNDEYNSLEEASLFVESALPQPLNPAPELWGHIRSRISDTKAPASLPGFLQIFSAPRWVATAAAVAAALVIGLGLWGYVHQREADQELNRYMTQYVEARELEEQMHRSDNVPLLYPAHMEFQANPFVGETVNASFSNPFRVE